MARLGAMGAAATRGTRKHYSITTHIESYS